MPMTTTAATFGLLPVPISVRKCRSRSAPNCSRPYGWGIASVPLTLCATACAAALERSSTGRMITWLRTPTRPFSRLYPQKVDLPRLMSMGSPPFRLDVVDVRVLAHLDRRHDAADVRAVLHDGRILGHRLDGELVADGDVRHRLHLDLLVLVHDPAGELLPGLHALDHHDADRVVLVVNHEMNHDAYLVHGSSSPPC